MNRNEDRILQAALAVVKDHTISGTRMHLIAENAQMRQSNLHYYYKTKDDLMLALQKRVLEKCLEIRAELSQKSEDTFESQLDIFILQKRAFILEYKEYDFAELDFWIQGRIYKEIGDGFAASFASWRREIGEILDKYIPGLDEEVRTFIPYQIVSMLEGATIQYLIDEDNFDLDHYFLACKKMILNAVAPYR
ncbi:MAG: TetR/AcrR family transcriptional regulator [Lachnospiraceae bacterium]